MAATQRICANDLKEKQYLVIAEEQLGRVKAIRKSKTGKHGGCKIAVRCQDVFTKRNVDVMVGSQDDVVITNPKKINGWKCVDLRTKEREADFELDDKKITLRVCEDDLAELQDEDWDLMEVTMIEFQDRHCISRINRVKAVKGKKKFYN